jgi:L-histidine Nalpha-methyltransferase
MIATTLTSPDLFAGAFAHDVVFGLSRLRKTLPAKWLYDSEGSRLFQQITTLPEYAVTRTERTILHKHGAAIAAFVGPEAVLVEYGAGSSEKAALLARQLKTPNAYVCIEIEPGAAMDAARGVGAAAPDLQVNAIVGDFTALDAGMPSLPEGRRVGFFPGSTIGNFEPVQATALLASFARHLGPGARLLLGVDRIKPPSVLIPAYDDAQGVTAAFNLNLLARINRELEGDFRLQNFKHEARWSEAERRIEMHLVSRSHQPAHVLGHRFSFAEGESIHTENSYKFDLDRLEAVTKAAGWRMTQSWSDANAHFTVAGLEC